ncbi:hypothetical protein NDI37_23785 [Funiculus sociatus GB2-A5]|uniref:Uncharacterized protein n=1 Tax=Funiculus sociatus GB2-A5 TaxID=2933946 RepID=A0ABV0JVJ4_9CYAN|nr:MULTISPECIES: hypothetical protein [unclassified Trichocoleus]MBD1903953.1 hypothetical protein [Trichocoleus sp. FACHB-832]MBD2061834.1 hypothetical protein [Trichocoleus sp. FACHB-6]
MQINISDQTKSKLVRQKYALPDQLFEDEVAVNRQKLSSEKLIKIFDQIWEKTLKYAVETAEVCEAKKAYERIPDYSRKHFNDNQEHREFRLKELNVEFIVQLLPLSNKEYELTDIWLLRSVNIDPRRILISFDTLEDRQRFEKIADYLNQKDSELGKQLLLDFMEKFNKSSFS